jgi:hypothetical protein
LKQPLFRTQYSNGFGVVRDGSCGIYQEFTFPELSKLLAKHKTPISLLEIGLGPKSIVGYLPEQQRRIIQRYTLYEPNSVFAARVEVWLGHTIERGDAPPHPRSIEFDSHRARPCSLRKF